MLCTNFIQNVQDGFFSWQPFSNQDDIGICLGDFILQDFPIGRTADELKLSFQIMFQSFLQLSRINRK